jgi:flagellar hook protein FlgE
MQRSKLVDSLHFLVDPIYKGIDMSTFSVMMEYILPISREYKTENLVKSDDLYKDKLEYKLPFDTCLTKEHGKIEVQLTFIKVELNPDGDSVQYVRKTSPATITILPISAWSDVIADDALTALDQRLIQTEALINAANEFNQYLYDTKADNIVLADDGKSLQLTAGGQPIGNKVEISCSASGIAEIHIDEDGNLVAVYNDGKQEIVGKTGSHCAGVYVPSMGEDILTFTLSEQAT